MLLERKQRENPEKYRDPNFHPRYRQTLPPGLGVKQVSSIINSEKSQRLGALSITFNGYTHLWRFGATQIFALEKCS